MDLIYSCAGTRPSDGSIYLLRNVGSRKEAVLTAPRMMKCFGEPIKVPDHGPHPWGGDGDGLSDLVNCVEWSVYPFNSHVALEMDVPPACTIGEIEVVEHGGCKSLITTRIKDSIGTYHGQGEQRMCGRSP